MKCVLTRLFNSVLVGLSLMLSVSAQEKPKTEPSPPPNPCPQFELRAPQARIVRDGENIAFSVSLAGGDASVVPTFVWSTSAGVIQSGQGTRNIRVDTTGAGMDRQLRVDIWVGGYPAECPLTGSSALQIAGPATRVAVFGELPVEKEIEELRSFADAISASSDNAYVFGYAGRNNARGYTNLALKRIKTQLLTNGIPYERLALIDGGFREQPAFELWVVPVGADAPKAKPTLTAKDIVYPKVTPAKKP